MSVPDSLLSLSCSGHVRGSFSGAVRGHHGLFESARGGTVVLDEIGDSSARMQGLLLRFFQFGEIQRIGESGWTRRVDVQLVATTRRILRELIADGDFRLDLYYRLNVINIHVPPLRDRSEDIPELLEHFTARFSEQQGVARRPIGTEAMSWLMTYSWPGNVRELRNVAERFVVSKELLAAVECSAQRGRSKRTGPTAERTARSGRTGPTLLQFRRDAACDRARVRRE